MAESIKRMDEIINALVSWLNEYPNHILTSTQRTRIENILERLKRSEPISLEEFVNYESKEFQELQEVRRQKSIFKSKYSKNKVPNSLTSFICDGCKEKIQTSEKQKHRKSCKEWKKIHRKRKIKIKPPINSMPTQISNDLPGKSYLPTGDPLKDQKLTERKIDGSRDMFQIRDNGKFGSYSSFDDYGEESSS